MADVAADALTVQYARRAPSVERGRTQSTAYIVREWGHIAAALLVGFGMNGPEYNNGSFERGISFSFVCALLALPAAAMVPISLLLLHAPPAAGSAAAPRSSNPNMLLEVKAVSLINAGSAPGSKHEYKSKLWHMLRSALVFELICFFLLSRTITMVKTTAALEIQRVWANVQVLQGQVFGILSSFLIIVALWLVRTRFLHASWRWMIMLTHVSINVIDAFFAYVTVYGIVRNQYFYLSDGLLSSMLSNVTFIFAAFVIVEVADPGLEGVTYGVFTTALNLGDPVASSISNAIFGLFRPPLSDLVNYLADAI